MSRYGGAGLILLFAPLAATWALAQLARARRWAAVSAGIGAILAPILLAFLLSDYAWRIQDPDRRVGIGGICIVMVYLFVLMTLFVIWGAPDRLIPKSRFRVRFNYPRPRRRLFWMQGVLLAFVGLCAIVAGAAIGDSLAGQADWLWEALLIDGGLALFLAGVYRGLLLGELGLNNRQDEPRNVR